MAFKISDAHIQDYHTRGYTVFQKILPPSLIEDLRRVTDRAREIARAENGPQTQRLQPVGEYDVDQKPFVDYTELPELVDAIAQLLSPQHRHGDRDWFGVLLEPAESPYSTPWHRDWRDPGPAFVLVGPVYGWSFLLHAPGGAFRESGCVQ